MGIIPINKNEFFKEVKIYFSNIMDGFDNYKTFNVEGSEEYIENYILKVFDLNKGYCYIDFYLEKLNEESRNLLLSNVDSKEQETLNTLFSYNSSNCYFKITSRNLLPLFIKLSTKELFFVTFYFTKTPLTLWGNYNLSFPGFILTEEDKNVYLNLK